MRTLLAAASILMLVGAGFGCGDDTTTVGPDMTAGADMSAIPHDMTLLNCGQILQCARTCTALACIQTCISEGKQASQQKVGALITCASAQCGTDGGVDQTCAATVIGQALSGSGPCMTQGAACASDM